MSLPLPTTSENKPRLPAYKYLALGIVVLLGLHFVAVSSSQTYSEHSSLTSLSGKLGLGSDGSPTSWILPKDASEQRPGKGSKYGLEEFDGLASNETRVNAAFVVLARNSDVWEILGAIRGMEDRFNSKLAWDMTVAPESLLMFAPFLIGRYNYDYVFLNDQPFTEEFKRHTSAIASGKCKYGQIPAEQWGKHPNWIDEERARKGREKLVEQKIIYGDSVSYREMCRYQSGFFYRHPLVQPYEFYWRIEPSVQFYCDLNYDPFRYMKENKIKYGFTISIYEYGETIPTLWQETKDFLKAHPEHVAKNNLQDFVTQDNMESYNRCHFWSNFEIGSLEFFRSKAYSDYFEWLDKAGGFFYERWGDAPVHSLAVAFLLKKEEVHFFSDIGYRHNPYGHCPKNSADRCSCNPADSFEDHWYSCTGSRYLKVGGL